MSKELEYIQRNIDIVKQQVKCSKMKIIVTDAVTKHQYDYYENELQTLESIEKALQRLEAIDNANPSEALEKLLDGYSKGMAGRSYYDTIKQALLKAQKEHKALEIIKEKYPDVVEVKLCKDYEHYKLRMSSKHDTEIVKIDWNDISLLDYLLLLTEEEFNLLKEVLE